MGRGRGSAPCGVRGRSDDPLPPPPTLSPNVTLIRGYFFLRRRNRYSPLWCFLQVKTPLSESSIFPTAGQLSWTTSHPTSHHVKLYDKHDLNTYYCSLLLSSLREKKVFFIANAYMYTYIIMAQKRFEDRDLII
jgi:hypothetical protein